MKRKYVWLGVCATVLLLSFLIPWIVLLIMENNAIGKVEQLNVSGELQSYGELSIARKQQLLESGELIISPDPTADAQEQKECVEEFREEIKLLVEGGALPGIMVDLSMEAFTVRGYLALHSQSSEAFRYYELSNDGNIRCYYDPEHQKILAIQIQFLTDFYFDSLYELGVESLEEALSQQLRTWANYYGHTVDDIYIETPEVVNRSEQTQVVISRFSEGDVSYRFGLFYDRETEALVWGICSQSEQQAVEEAAGG